MAVCVPAESLRRRPDIRRAEYCCRRAAPRIGVAMGDWYPQFTLTGTVGVSATDISRLFTSNSLTYNYGPNVHWNIFQFGRIRNNVALQQALFEDSCTPISKPCWWPSKRWSRRWSARCRKSSARRSGRGGGGCPARRRAFGDPVPRRAHQLPDRARLAAGTARAARPAQRQPWRGGPT